MADVSNEARTLSGQIIAQPSNPPRDPPHPARGQLPRSHENTAYSTPHIERPSHPARNQPSGPSVSPSANSTPALTDAVNRNASASRISENSQMAENGGPSPYGTRSRNRNGNARPNYAEDRDLEADVEWGSSKKANATSKTNAAQETPPDNEKSSGVSTRRSSAVTLPSATKPASAQATKDNLPGMSSFALQPEPSTNNIPQSKKRKAPGSSVQNVAIAQQAAPSSTNGAVKKSANNGGLHAHRETNMMTFERSGGKLKNGKLIADDGVSLEVHGKPSERPMSEEYYLFT